MFADQLAQLWVQIFGHPPLSDGLAPATSDQAENRLGLALPTPLKDFYRLLGRNQIAMRAHLRFRKPSELEVIHAGLIFCEENQRVYFNAVRVRQ